MGTRPTGSAWYCLGNICGGGGRTGVSVSTSMSLYSLGSGLGM